MRSKISPSLLTVFSTVAFVFAIFWSRPLIATEAFIGQIQFFPYNFAPRSWAFCNGQLLPISQNSALFSLLGTTFGGDGRTSFGLPDMRGRVPVHPGRGPGLTVRQWGEKGGVERVTLTTNQMPSHSHNLMGTDNLGDQASPTGNALSRDGRDQTYRNEAPNTDMHSASIGAAGAGQAHENMAPYLALNCNIATQGVYPSRN